MTTTTTPIAPPLTVQESAMIPNAIGAGYFRPNYQPVAGQQAPQLTYTQLSAIQVQVKQMDNESIRVQLRAYQAAWIMGETQGCAQMQTALTQRLAGITVMKSTVILPSPVATPTPIPAPSPAPAATSGSGAAAPAA